MRKEVKLTTGRFPLSKDGGISIKVTFDEAEVRSRIGASMHKAQMKLDQQVITDSNFYCPLKTGTLQKSATINTVLGSGVVRWQTPYAHMQYYGVNFDRSQDPNPNACGKWFEAAKAHKKEQWRKLVDDTVKGG